MADPTVGDLLREYGAELEAAGAAQVGGSFSGDESADSLLRADANAFLLGVLFTQGIPAERAWSAPYLLRKRLGTLDPATLAADPAAVREAVQRYPMLHRFKETLPRWIVAASEILVERYGSDASLIWEDGASVLEVTERLSEFPGIGRKKAVMAAEILVRHFGVALEGRDSGQVAYDVHVRRVFLRSGLCEEDTPDAVEAAASLACPESPGTLDLPAWLIGRETCRPRAPKCGECRLVIACAKRIAITPRGVGQRPTLPSGRPAR